MKSSTTQTSTLEAMSKLAVTLAAMLMLVVGLFIVLGGALAWLLNAAVWPVFFPDKAPLTWTEGIGLFFTIWFVRFFTQSKVRVSGNKS